MRRNTDLRHRFFGKEHTKKITVYLTKATTAASRKNEPPNYRRGPRRRATGKKEQVATLTGCVDEGMTLG